MGGRPWDDGDDVNLRYYAAIGYSPDVVAKLVGRTYPSVNRRARFLGVKWDKGGRERLPRDPLAVAAEQAEAARKRAASAAPVRDYGVLPPEQRRFWSADNWSAIRNGMQQYLDRRGQARDEVISVDNMDMVPAGVQQLVAPEPEPLALAVQKLVWPLHDLLGAGDVEAAEDCMRRGLSLLKPSLAPVLLWYDCGAG